MTDRVKTVEELYAIMTERERSINLRFESQDKAVNAALTAAKEAVGKAEIAAEKRFDSVNEFRNTLKDQQATFVARPEADARFKAIEDRLVKLDSYVSTERGKDAGVAWLRDIIIGLLGLAFGAATVLLTYYRK